MNNFGKNTAINDNVSNKTEKYRYKNFSVVLKPNKNSIEFAKPKNKVSKVNKSEINETEPSMQDYIYGNLYKNNTVNIDKLSDESNKSVVQKIRLNSAGKVVADIMKNQIDSYDELENYKRLLKKRKKRLIARIFTFLLLLIVAPVMIFLGTIIIDKNSRHDFFGYNFYIIATESMEPEIMVNDCVVLSKVTDVYSLEVGDDIGYIDDKGSVIVHRIEKVVETANGNLEFEVGGINNLSSDQKRVGFEQIVGKRIATLSILGNAIVFFRSIPGIILFICIFVGVIVAFYVAFSLSENIKYIENVE